MKENKAIETGIRWYTLSRETAGDWERTTRVFEVPAVGCMVHTSTLVDGVPSESSVFLPGAKVQKLESGTYRLTEGFPDYSG